MVADSMGEFSEHLGWALTEALATSDPRFKYDLQGLVMGRRSSGTLVLTDTPTALTCAATRALSPLRLTSPWLSVVAMYAR